MGEGELDNLARIGQLKKEAPDRAEIVGLIRSGRTRLADAKNGSLSLESRFDLAYNAAHALALAAMRGHGYRPGSRYQVFQCLVHTLDLPIEEQRILIEAHRRRNLAEYEGHVEVDENLVDAMVRVASELSVRLNGP